MTIVAVFRISEASVGSWTRQKQSARLSISVRSAVFVASPSTLTFSDQLWRNGKALIQPPASAIDTALHPSVGPERFFSYVRLIVSVPKRKKRWVAHPAGRSESGAGVGSWCVSAAALRPFGSPGTRVPWFAFGFRGRSNSLLAKPRFKHASPGNICVSRQGSLVAKVSCE